MPNIFEEKTAKMKNVTIYDLHFIFLQFRFMYPESYYAFKTRCRPCKGRRCIPDVEFNNEGKIVESCRNMNVYIVKTDIC